MKLFNAKKAAIDHNVRLMNGDIAVVETLSDTASQCECLAAWVDGETCICGDKTVNVPLSRKSVQQAQQIFAQIDKLERFRDRVAQLNEAGIFVDLNYQQSLSLHKDDDFHPTYRHPEPFFIPKTVILALIKSQLLEQAESLTKTGLVSAPTDNTVVKIHD